MVDRLANDDENTELVQVLYESLLMRSPSGKELGDWVAAARTFSAAEFVRRILRSSEYETKHRVRPFFPNGHYHSAVVDPSTVRDYVDSRRLPKPNEFGGIEIDVDKMEALWNGMSEWIAADPFPFVKSADFRFYYEGGPFPYGDALSLHGMLGYFRPSQIVEIGSGFSTACMLDSLDLHGLNETQITCIEPFPDRLKSLLRPGDLQRVTILDIPVQNVPVSEVVGGLNRNDILFIDSTHVIKTGSDVHYEIFEILPALRRGVIIHVHDCPYPFEYPQQWIDQNYSWNEAYAIRAFLMFNHEFKSLFWGSLFKVLFTSKVAKEGGSFSKNPGTSLWLMRV